MNGLKRLVFRGGPLFSSMTAWLPLRPLLAHNRASHLALMPSQKGSPSPQPVDLEGLFVAHGPYLARLLFRLVGRETDVEDLVQDVFVQALRRIESLRDPAAARAWLSQVAVRLATRRLKRRRFRRLFHIDHDEGSTEHVRATGLDADEQRLLQQVFESLDGVASDDRVAWVLRVVEQRPLDEVATLCNCSLATVKRRISAVEKYLAEVFHD
jgi:RNA polymerase sigma-70 factor (ECF subfamily)